VVSTYIQWLILVNPLRLSFAGSTFSGGVHAKLSLKGFTKINPWMYVDTTHQTVVIKLIAAATPDNNGFNFDGYYNGKANFVVPLGWTVTWAFTNKAALPHSAALTIGTKLPPKFALIAGSQVETPNPTQGIATGKEQDVTFGAVDAGRYGLVCLVAGHLAAGMWDHFTVSSTAKMPSIQLSK